MQLFLVRIRALALILVFSLWGCLNYPDETNSHGGGSDTETLSGTVSIGNGVFAARTLVKLVPANYNPSKPDTALILKAITNNNGQFNFDKVNKYVYYNLIAGKSSDQVWVFADSLKANGGRLDLTMTKAKLLLVSLESSIYKQQDSGLAYFPGTDILTHCNGIEASRIDSLPMGVSRLRVESRAGWAHDTTLVNIKDSMEVKADQSGIKWMQ
jgi:hypothetical protein